MIIWSFFSLYLIYGDQIRTGNFDIYWSLFGLPFIAGSIFFWSVTFIYIFGKVELRLKKQGGEIFTGIGKIGMTKRFTWDEVERVEEKIKKGKNNNSPLIVMTGKKKNISFGGFLSPRRRYYLMRTLELINTKLELREQF